MPTLKQIESHHVNGCLAVGKRTARLARARLLDLFSRLPFADSFPGIVMGNGDMFFCSHENCIKAKHDGEDVSLKWSELFSTIELHSDDYYQMSPAVARAVHEIHKVVTFLMDTHYTDIFNITPEELCAHRKTKSKRSRSRSQNGELAKGRSTLPRSILKTALC